MLLLITINPFNFLNAQPNRTKWTYDSTNQLIDDLRSGSNSYRRTYTYDPVGNCRVKDISGSLTTSTFDGADQLIDSVDSTGITTYGFDPNGNQALVVAPGGSRTTSTWGFENQAELVVLPTGARVTSMYNADIRKSSKCAALATYSLFFRQ